MARMNPGRGRRAQVLATLEAHGLTAAGAEALRRLGVELRERMLRTKREYGAFVDAETGESVGGVLTGAGDRLEARSVLQAMIPGRRYAGVHTHPEGASFSPTDGTVLVAHASTVCAIAVVGGPGIWYVLSPVPGRTLPSPEAVFPAFERERDALAPPYEALLRAGALTRREAQRAHTHEVWERLAPVLGLRYDRV